MLGWGLAERCGAVPAPAPAGPVSQSGSWRGHSPGPGADELISAGPPRAGSLAGPGGEKGELLGQSGQVTGHGVSGWGRGDPSMEQEGRQSRGRRKVGDMGSTDRDKWKSKEMKRKSSR